MPLAEARRQAAAFQLRARQYIHQVRGILVFIRRCTAAHARCVSIIEAQEVLRRRLCFRARTGHIAHHGQLSAAGGKKHPEVFLAIQAVNSPGITALRELKSDGERIYAAPHAARRGIAGDKSRAASDPDVMAIRHLCAAQRKTQFAGLMLPAQPGDPVATMVSDAQSRLADDPCHSYLNSTGVIMMTSVVRPRVPV